MRRRTVMSAGTVLLAAVAVFLTLDILAHRRPPGWASGDATEIRLVGVRPDEGDFVYDAAGRTSSEDKNFDASSARWKAGQMHRTFIFALPDGVQLASDMLPTIGVGMRNASASCSGVVRETRTGRQYILTTDITPGRWHIGPLSWPWPQALPRAVDVTLRYYSGPRTPAAYCFTEPFTMDTAKNGDGAPGADLVPQTSGLPAYVDRGISFTFTSPREAPGQPWFAYDRSGSRHEGHVMSGYSGPNGARCEFYFDDVVLEDIAAITVGERPLERTFHKIRVVWSGAPVRLRPEYMDKIADVLAFEDKADDGLASGRLRKAEDAVKVVDLVRGGHLREAANAIAYGGTGFDPAELDEASRAKVKAAALEWAESGQPAVTMCGVKVGLRCGWREFVPYAFDLIAREGSDGNGTFAADAAGHLSRYWKLLADDDYARMRDALAKTDDPRICHSLTNVLVNWGTPAARTALISLANDARPWLWEPAAEALSRQPDALGEPGQWGDELSARVFLATGQVFGGADEAAVAVRACALLPRLLTPRIQAMNQDAFARFLTLTAEKLDKQAATASIISYIKAVGPVRRGDSQEYGLCRAVWTLDRLRGIDIGGIASCRDASEAYGYMSDWEQTAADAVTWSETGVDPGALRAGYRAQPGDFRIVWVEDGDREQSMIAAWPAPQDPSAKSRLYRLSKDKRFYAYRLRLKPGEARVWEAQTYVGIAGRGGYDTPLAFTMDKPSEQLFSSESSPSNPAKAAMNCSIYIEAADSPTSVLSGTKVFNEWWARYGPEGVTAAAAPQVDSSAAP